MVPYVKHGLTMTPEQWSADLLQTTTTKNNNLFNFLGVASF